MTCSWNAVGIVVLVISRGLLAEPPNQDENLTKGIKLLAECPMTDCTATVGALIQSGADSLRVLLGEFDDLPSVATFIFRSQVLAHLPPEEAGLIVLDLFRRHEQAFDEFAELAKRAARGEPIDDNDPAYADLFRRHRRARWAAAALGDIRYRAGYDAVYSKYAPITEFRNGHSDLAHGLFGMDPERAVRDFSKLAESENETERVKGVTSFRQVARTPDCTILGQLFNDPSESVRREALQLMYYTQRDCANLLIRLTGDENPQLREAANARLRHLGHVSTAQWQVMMANAESPNTRAARWTEWWHGVQNLSDAQLRKRGFNEALAFANRKLDAPLVSFLAEYSEFQELFPLLKRALSSEDEAVRKDSLNAIQRLAIRGEPRAIDIVLEHASAASIHEAAACADAISKISDSRIVPLLLRLLEKAPLDPPTDARNILLALGNTRDSRAVAPVLSVMLNRTDGTEQYAAMVLPKLEGAASVQPKLLSHLLQERNHNTRYALRETIRTIGGASLPEALTRVLPDAGAGDELLEGPQKEVLLLMEEFPDPASAPLLRELLNAESRFTRLYAARALAKLGDKSGASVVLGDLFTSHPVPYHFYAHDVGTALKDIGDLSTRDRLEQLCRKVSGEDRQRVLHVMAQQEDPSYIPFLSTLIRRGDRPDQCGAALAVSALIHKTPVAQKRQGLDLRRQGGARVAKVILRWAFCDEPPNADCGSFPDHGSLKNMSGAVVKIANNRHVLYKVGDDSLTLLSESNADDKALIDKAKPRSEDTWAYGELGVEESRGFLSAFLKLDYGGAGYFFQMTDGAWEPVCTTLGIIE